MCALFRVLLFDSFLYFYVRLEVPLSRIAEERFRILVVAFLSLGIGLPRLVRLWFAAMAVSAVLLGVQYGVGFAS